MCSYQTFLGRQTNPETLVEFFSNRNVQSVDNQDFFLTTMQMMLKILPSHFSCPAEKKLSLLENPERKEG